MFKFKISKRKIFSAFIAIIVITVIFYLIIFINFIPPNMKIKSTGDGYSIKTEGCSIPSLHPYGPAVLPFIFKDPPLKCGNVPPLVTSDLDTLYVNLSLLQAYNVTNLNHFHCCYQEVTRKKRPPDMEPELSNNSYIISQVCVRFKIMIKIDIEFVRVICENNWKEIYRDYHSFIPLKKSKSKKPSVLVIGIDTVSHTNFHRQMPKTAAYLQTLNAFEFFGYNKVADNTFPNLIPALSGKFEDELYESCLTSKWMSLPTKFDDCNFIWNNYSRAGFLTAFIEGSSRIGLFNFGRRYGFDNPPTDYCWNIIEYASEQELGSNPYLFSSLQLCIGAKHKYKIMLEYMKKFVYTLENESYFGWFWECSLTHTQMNFASICDDDYEIMFREFNRTNVLNNTIIIFLSDHGPRSGAIMLTHQGFLESRLPFLYILLPPWFKKLYPTAVQNLHINTRRLITTFDIHETLNDLINIEDLTTEKLVKRTNALSDERGISLFVPVPETRTCLSAGIPMHWCSCFQSAPIKTTDVYVKNVALFVVNYINLLLDDKQNCAKLFLDSIINARLLISEEFRDIPYIILKERLKLYNYVVTLKTGPNGAIFDSTVRCYNCEKNGNFEIQGTIGRLNRYENEGDCMDDHHLKMYCYCKK